VCIGREDEIEDIEKNVKCKYPSFEKFKNTNQQKEKEKEINLERRIQEIYSNIDCSNKKTIKDEQLTGYTELTIIPLNAKKLIFQQNELKNENGHELELRGANGEEQVLSYFIQDFMKLEAEEKIKGINEVYSLLREKLGNETHKVYKDKCLESVGDDVELKRALIPFFYVTMHHKYSYFDLIAYKNGQPVLIEVKTTNSDHNKRFFLSVSEVNAAKSKDNYEIVRVSPSSILFIGNPIKLFEEKILYINGDNFSLTPRNYEFNFN